MQPQPVAKASILIADDEPGIRKLISQVLIDRGYSVITANDGRTALTAARKHEGKLDLLITDVMMPKVDGFDLREQILRERPDLKVLIISGQLDSELLGEDFAILRKPFRPDELAEKVAQMLSHAS